MNQYPLMRIQGRNALRLQRILNSSLLKLNIIYSKGVPSRYYENKIINQLHFIKRNLVFEKRLDLVKSLEWIIKYIRTEPELCKDDEQAALIFIDNMKRKMKLL